MIYEERAQIRRVRQTNWIWSDLLLIGRVSMSSAAINPHRRRHSCGKFCVYNVYGLEIGWNLCLLIAKIMVFKSTGFHLIKSNDPVWESWIVKLCQWKFLSLNLCSWKTKCISNSRLTETNHNKLEKKKNLRMQYKVKIACQSGIQHTFHFNHKGRTPKSKTKN